MSLNTVSTIYDYDIADIAYFIVPRTQADTTFKQISLKKCQILAKRSYVQPTQSTPTIIGPNISVVQYDVRFLDNTTLTVIPSQLLSGIEAVANIIA